MKNIVVFTAVFVLMMGFLKAQTVSVSQDYNKISFVINDKTTKAEIQKADSIFKAHSIITHIKTTLTKGQISKVKVKLNCSQGSTNYQTDKADIIKKGVLIWVDRSKNACVAFSVGPNKD
jgi:hypothetical protein